MIARLLLALRTTLAAVLARAGWRGAPVRVRVIPAPAAPPKATGVYRARPELPAPPPPVPVPTPPRRRRVDPRREPLLHAVGATVLTLGGLFLAVFPRQAHHRFWGVLGVALFGAAAWVFGEQVAAGVGTAPLEPRARRRAAVVTAIGGVAVLWVDLVSVRVGRFDRLLGAGLGLLLLLPALVGLWTVLRARRRAAEPAARPARVSRARYAQPLPPSHTRVVGPAPRAPDLTAQRRRWRRRG